MGQKPGAGTFLLYPLFRITSRLLDQGQIAPVVWQMRECSPQGELEKASLPERTYTDPLPGGCSVAAEDRNSSARSPHLSARRQAVCVCTARCGWRRASHGGYGQAECTAVTFISITSPISDSQRPISQSLHEKLTVWCNYSLRLRAIPRLRRPASHMEGHRARAPRHLRCCRFAILVGGLACVCHTKKAAGSGEGTSANGSRTVQGGRAVRRKEERQRNSQCPTL